MKKIKALLLITGLFTCVIAFAANVTFRVDMSLQTVPPEGVHIAGNFQGWNPGATIMTTPGGNIYTYTQSFTTGSSLEYKFINGDEWGEDESVPSECALNNNRYLTVPETDTVLTAVCFGSCDPCGNQTSITFQVDMSEQTVSPLGVHVAGSFQGWNASSTLLADQGNGLFTVTVSVSENETVYYKFINGNDWTGAEGVPASCGVPDGFGGYNRFYDVPVGGGAIGEVCFGSCYPCGFVPTEVDITFRIDMSLEEVSPDGVHIAGSFQNWDPGANEMVNIGDNIYEATFTLWAADHHQYKFINGITWDDEEIVPAECGVDNGQGGYNRFIDVPGVDSVLTTLCYSSCEPCGNPPVEVDVTFSVDMSDETISPDGIHIAGSFQGWDPAASPMTDAGDNIYSATFTLFSDEYHEYKFINGNTWDGKESVPPACGVDDGQGGFNRFITLPAVDTVTQLVCFGSCDSCSYVPFEVTVTFRVDLSEVTISPNGVHIAADFQGWDPGSSVMTEVDSGVFEASFNLWSGDYHQYKFINGNTWDDEEIVPAECGHDNGQGGYNRYIDVPGENIILTSVCFSSCDPCSVGTDDNTAGIIPAGSFKVLPNPFSGQIIVEYELSGPAQVNVAILDVCGKTITETGFEKQDAGTNHVSPDVSILSAGIYFCRLQVSSNDEYTTTIQKIIRQ